MMKPINKQTGAALITSMVILAILAIMGFSALSTSMLSERVASNRQQLTTAFFSAQSAINVFVAAGNDDDSSLLKQTRDIADANVALKDNTAELIGCVDGVTGEFNPNCNQTVFNPVGTVKAKVAAKYKGCNTAPVACTGFSMNIGTGGTAGCHEYEIVGQGWYASDKQGTEPGNKDITTSIKQTVTQVALCVEE